MGSGFLPTLLPWEPKSIFELALSFSTPFHAFMSWCGRRKISEISNHDILPPKTRSPISPEQSFFDDLSTVAKTAGFFEDGHFVCRTMSDISLLLSSVLDFAARRVIPPPANGNPPSSRPLEDFNVDPCNIACQGMEAWTLYQSDPGKPYMVALYVLPPFFRDDALGDFISTHNICREPASRSGPRTAFTQSETMWSMVLDACVSSRCTTFVVSSYHRWVFGKFTPDFSSASVSPIVDLNSESPTVPEALYQWITHAFDTRYPAEDAPSEEPPSDQDEWPLTFMDMQFQHRHKLYDLWNIQ